MNITIPILKKWTQLNFGTIKNGIKKTKLFGIQLTMEKLSLNYNIIMKIMHTYLLKE